LCNALLSNSLKVIVVLPGFPSPKALATSCFRPRWRHSRRSSMTHGAAPLPGSSVLLFLQPFLSVTETSHSNATMMVISLCLSERVST
jgi:hypothetical protein